MLIKVLLGSDHTKILNQSKQKRYGEDSTKIRTAYELSQIVNEGQFSINEINEKAANEGDKKEYKSTTFNLSAGTVKTLDDLCSQTRLSRAEVIRAIILIQNENLDGTRTEKGSIITAATLDKNASLGEIISKILYNFNAKNASKALPVVNVLELWTENNNNYDIENPKLNPVLESFYKDLGWGEYSHYDLVNSLYKPFLCYCAVNDENPTRPLFKIEENEFFFDHASKKAHPDYIKEIKKEFFAKTYIDYYTDKKKNLGNRSDDKEVIYDKLVHNPSLNEMAKIVYTIANIAPCPSYAFNQIKGIIANDNLSLFVNILYNGTVNADSLKSYNKILERSGLTLTSTLCREYIEWLIINQNKAFLQDYYHVDNKEEGRIIGIPQFPNQTLHHTIPDDAFTLSCYVQNTISRIYSRALRIAQYIANK